MTDRHHTGPHAPSELPEQTTHKTWASAVGAILANVISFGLAKATGTTLSADTYFLLVTVLTPLGAAAGTYFKRNYVKGVHRP